MSYILIAVGLAALLAGGEAVVRGAVAIADRFGVSKLVIGLTIVGFGTSLPELLTSVQAARAGSPAIALGNVVGSNTANILLILGVSAVLWPIAVNVAAFRRDGAVLAASTLALIVIVVAFPLISPMIAIAMLLALGIYMTTLLVSGEADPDVDLNAPRNLGVGAASLWCATGVALMVFGAAWLVAGATELARTAGVSEAIIGVTVVAVGTSLPELVTSVTAAFRKQGDIAFGNVVGSNIFNILGILSITALVAPVSVDAQIAGFDIWVMAAATASLLIVGFAMGRIGRMSGLAAVLGYAGYLAVLVTFAAGI